jgi:uncharacterized membrane protein
VTNSSHTTPPSGVHASAHPASRNIERIARLERDEKASQTLGTRLSLAVTNAAGTPLFAVVHVLLFTSWMTWNAAAPQAYKFDPYPFGLLTMAVSMEGVILAILVLITQNRMSAQSDQRDHLNLQVDLLAEQEMTVVLRLLGRICEQVGVPLSGLEREEVRKLMSATDLDHLIQAIGHWDGAPEEEGQPHRG